jgi:2'-5' RNA ligase
VETALVLTLAEAGPFDEIRREFASWSVARGIPFHITLLWPFAPAEELTGALLGDVRSFFASQRTFDFALTRVAMWPRDVYAVPEPEDALRACMQALHAAFPRWPPYRGIHADIVPHATLGEDLDAKDVYPEIERRATPHLPYRCQARDVALLEEYARDKWRERDRFPLSG